jgi:hypothetical protein
MYLKTKLLQPGLPPTDVQVPQGATLADVIEKAGATLAEGVLTQNGRRARPSDPVEPGATVMRMPRAEHG